jgi:DNA-nicking Smr family endonuclease
MADDFERRLQAAYASGDPDAVLCVLGGGVAGSGREESSALNPSASEFVPSSYVTPVEPSAQAGGGAREAGSDAGDENLTLVALCAAFPHADSNVVLALLYAHGGDADAARATLVELNDAGALDAGSQSETGAAAIDLDAYTAALAQFDDQFPSLGGAGGVAKARSAREPGSAAFGGERLLASMRERSLQESMPWIRGRVVSEVYRAAGDADVARARLSAAHPKPTDWDANRAKAQEAIRAAILSASASLSTNDYDDDVVVGSGGAEATRWVQSGEAVSRLYAEKRDSAGKEARQRNKYFELAAEKARTGRGAEAARLGALGRASNVRMKALHREAADMMWESNNGNFVREGLLDLHGLHVAEALERLPGALDAAARAGRRKLRIVFGTGHHSKGGGGAPRLRPAVLSWFRESQHAFVEVQDSKTRLVGAVSVSLR